MMSSRGSSPDQIWEQIGTGAPKLLLKIVDMGFDMADTLKGRCDAREASAPQAWMSCTSKWHQAACRSSQRGLPIRQNPSNHKMLLLLWAAWNSCCSQLVLTMKRSLFAYLDNAFVNRGLSAWTVSATVSTGLERRKCNISDKLECHCQLCEEWKTRHTQPPGPAIA